MYEEKDEGSRQVWALGMSENPGGWGRQVVGIIFPLVEIGVN
jgi:hypothetical protein